MVSDAPLGRNGETVYVARVPAQDAARFAAAQDQIQKLREQGVEWSGTLSVEILGGCHVGPFPETLTVRTWLKTGPESGFVPLTRGIDLLSETDAQAAEQIGAALREC